MAGMEMVGWTDDSNTWVGNWPVAAAMESASAVGEGEMSGAGQSWQPRTIWLRAQCVIFLVCNVKGDRCN